MWPSVLVLSAVAMVALWIVAGLYSRKRARVRRELTFLFGTFVVWPALAAALFALLGESVLAGSEKPVGEGASRLIAIAAGGTLVTWLVGFWVATAVGWWIGRKHVGV